MNTLGLVKLSLKLGKLPMTHDFLVIDGNKDTYPLLIGTDLLNKFNSFTFKRDTNSFIINDNIKTECRFLNWEEITKTSLDMKLTPWKMKMVNVALPFGFNCFEEELLLSSPNSVSGLMCLPSISNVNKKKITIGLVNVTNQYQNLTSEIEFEDCFDSTPYNIKQRGLDKIKDIIEQFPQIVPILENYKDVSINSIPTVSMVKTSNNIKDLINEPEEGLEFNSGEISEVEIENLSKLNAGYGIDDVNLEPVEDIVNLPQFPEHVQGYIKDIFIDSYPDSLARHAWDAGELSHFLGKCTLKLKPNEKLPRNRRIYALTRPEQEHLNEIVSFMMKMDLVRKSPEFDKNPGYGCACYLISGGNNSVYPFYILLE